MNVKPVLGFLTFKISRFHDTRVYSIENGYKSVCKESVYAHKCLIFQTSLPVKLAVLMVASMNPGLYSLLYLITVRWWGVFVYYKGKPVNHFHFIGTLILTTVTQCYGTVYMLYNKLLLMSRTNSKKQILVHISSLLIFYISIILVQRPITFIYKPTVGLLDWIKTKNK